MVGLDRLSDLGPIPEDPPQEIKGGKGDIEMQAIIDKRPLAGEGFLADFYDDVGKIKKKFAIIRANTKELQELHQKTLTSVCVEKSAVAEDKEDIADDTSYLANQIRADLKALEATMDPALAQTAEGRIKANTHAALGRKFMQIMTEYTSVQSSYKAACQARMARQLKIAKPGATPEEIAAMVEDADESQSVFTENMLSASHAAAKNALADVKEKHQDILRLEKSMEELHQLFVDMANLVEQQGELLNQIEYQVGQSITYVEEGLSALVDAAESQRSAQKKKCFCICCIIVILIVIGVVIFVILKVKGTILGAVTGDGGTSAPGSTPKPS